MNYNDGRFIRYLRYGPVGVAAECDILIVSIG